jgi:ABC-type Fe3+-hydroxamate transport system substrate-binding protein
MPLFTDQTGRTISLHAAPRRIVSIVPSQTELLHYLGLEEEVIGITKFCVHPKQWFRNKTRVGGTKHLSVDIIQKLQPDLIIANKEENVKEQVELLAQQFPVWVSDVNNLDDACSMITSIGEMVQKADAARKLVDNIRSEFRLLQNNNPPLRAAYLIWRDPYMTIGHDTFIHDMLTRCGFENIFADRTRYPTVSIEELSADSNRLQVLLLSSEPFPFGQKHIDELQPLLPHTKIILADGEMFSWYGSRLLHSPAYFVALSQKLKVKSQK